MTDYSAEFITRDSAHGPGGFFRMGNLVPVREPSSPRFDGGDGGDEDDGETAPITYLRMLFDRGVDDRTSYATLRLTPGGYCLVYELQADWRCTRLTLPNHDPGDEDQWVSITSEELAAAVIYGLRYT